MNTPLYTRLKKYYSQNRISFAMPGHKNGRGLRRDLLDCDVTELDETENLHNPGKFIKESKRLLSELFGSDESFIMTCGSTAGIQAMIASAVKPGGTLLAAADCHMSVINTCSLLGINLKFISRETDAKFLIPKRIESVEKYICGADAVIITSPTYYGLCSDIESISKICHERGIPLLVDEAHGAHFISSAEFPTPAVMSGADAVCQSAHKTLNALTGAAFLHVKSGLINRAKLAKLLAMFQTSSPSYIIAASADIAASELRETGWDKICALCDDFKKTLSSETDIEFLENDDCTRLVLCFGKYDTSVFQIKNILSKSYKIDVEMADLLNLVLIVTPSNTREDLDALRGALIEITSGLRKRTEALKITPLPTLDGVISPRDALFADTEKTAFTECAGRISAATVTAYPPGIPIICAGAEITRAQLEYIEYLREIGAEIIGADGGMIEVLRR
ncbi:MAG: aminotransferase class I/II-fold pyridoxal phosphate-dependent enzyme [Oscillospiraceae bacterium]|nr:aminotransferase class I/II-fold pyridoxal phosphate-dependent enzyme [Oscillospiraceae bacterium]